jgi:hypothetical protein
MSDLVHLNRRRGRLEVNGGYRRFEERSEHAASTHPRGDSVGNGVDGITLETSPLIAAHYVQPDRILSRSAQACGIESHRKKERLRDSDLRQLNLVCRAREESWSGRVPISELHGHWYWLRQCTFDGDDAKITGGRDDGASRIQQAAVVNHNRDRSGH